MHSPGTGQSGADAATDPASHGKRIELDRTMHRQDTVIFLVFLTVSTHCPDFAVTTSVKVAANDVIRKSTRGFMVGTQIETLMLAKYIGTFGKKSQKMT
jgi:hypothetical protein